MTTRGISFKSINTTLFIEIMVYFFTSTIHAMHAMLLIEKNHGIHHYYKKNYVYRMEWRSYSSSKYRKLEGERDITLGFVDLLRDDFIEQDRSRGIYFTQDWVSLPGYSNSYLCQKKKLDSSILHSLHTGALHLIV
ncbi:hypothetical protein R3W88_018384 [Solanum pinnatisectum]|uniref:Ribulose bisphosphate carboxylase large subunit C-terminal domain-containing protein n=1 Tax=Solanum pinnatisectum TaxID=50273 RepID=A0AAV9L382_9SOLN|nr:hypothetical protein R3W88_018384 [Solanum pinnatisectum]